MIASVINCFRELCSTEVQKTDITLLLNMHFLICILLFCTASSERKGLHASQKLNLFSIFIFIGIFSWPPMERWACIPSTMVCLFVQEIS